MSESKISWGKVIAGAAIAAGAVAAVALFPEEVAKVGSYGKELLADAYHAIGSAGSWMISQLGSLARLVAENKEIAIASAAGAGAVIGAAAHGKRQEPDLEEISFAAREDTRRMQALMVARMQAQGYEPAMAMAGQSRG